MTLLHKRMYYNVQKKVMSELNYKTSFPFKKKDKEFFQKYGFLYVKNFLPNDIFDRLLEEIKQLIKLFSEKEKLSPILNLSEKEFDFYLAKLINKDRALAGHLYEAVKKLPSHISLASHQRHIVACKFLKDIKFPGFASRGWGLRMDHPKEDNFLTQLHQDFVSQLCSPEGLVFWTPLRDVDSKLGPVKIYPKTHLHGIFPVEVTGEGSYDLNIRNLEVIREKFSYIAPEVMKGDTVIMDYLTLHESSPNQSSLTRWSLITRFFEFQNQIAIDIGWKGGVQEGNSFDKVLPQYSK